jgi:hypothetical protein
MIDQQRRVIEEMASAVTTDPVADGYPFVHLQALAQIILDQEIRIKQLEERCTNQ